MKEILRRYTITFEGGTHAIVFANQIQDAIVMIDKLNGMCDMIKNIQVDYSKEK
jgi:hypothetical protein